MLVVGHLKFVVETYIRNVTLMSKVRAVAILLLLNAENYKLWNWGSSELRNICFKFNETWTSLSEVSIEGAQTDSVKKNHSQLYHRVECTHSLIVLGLNIQHDEHIGIFLKLNVFIFMIKNGKLYSADRGIHKNLMFLCKYVASVCTVYVSFFQICRAFQFYD
jgi:hypothetical protein